MAYRLSGTPLFDAGVDRPIAAAPSIGTYKGHTVVAFGTGGTDWAVSNQNLVGVCDLTDDVLLFTVSIGSYKLVAPISITQDGRLVYTAVSGTLNSPDPRMDLADPNDPNAAYLAAIHMDRSQSANDAQVTIAKGRGNIWVKNNQIYAGGSDGKLRQFRERENNKTGEKSLKWLLWKDLSQNPAPPPSP